MHFWTPRSQLQVRLHKVDQNSLFWIFFFRDPVNHFIQSAIVPKTASWEAVAALWDDLHKRMGEGLKDRRN